MTTEEKNQTLQLLLIQVAAASQFVFQIEEFVVHAGYGKMAHVSQEVNLDFSCARHAFSDEFVVAQPLIVACTKR